MFFVGIDLAWSDTNKTGMVILSDEKVIFSGLVQSDDDICSCIAEVVGSHSCVVAIDAPLVVPNTSGQRPAETLLNKDFRKYNAGAHPANRTWLLRSCSRIRGEDLVIALKSRGIVHDPFLRSSRSCFECYPHSASIVLFGLKQILGYKARPSRSYEDRWNAFVEYQRQLSRFVSAPFLSVDVTSLRASKLKEYEDVLDACMCAIIARFLYQNPSERMLYGSFDDGYILTPALRI